MPLVERIFTTAKAVTAVGRQRSTEGGTSRWLRSEPVGTTVAAGKMLSGVVRAADLRIHAGRGGLFKWIAVVIPLASIVARSGVLVPVTVGLARSIVLTGYVAEKTAFVVLARAQTIGIEGVDETVAVVVDAIAALVDFALAWCDVTAEDAGVGVDYDKRVSVWNADVAICQRIRFGEAATIAAFRRAVATVRVGQEWRVAAGTSLAGANNDQNQRGRRFCSHDATFVVISIMRFIVQLSQSIN